MVNSQLYVCMYVWMYGCTYVCMCLWADATDHLPPPIEWLKLGVGLYPTVRISRRQLRGRKGREVVSVSPLFPWRFIVHALKEARREEGRKEGRRRRRRRRRWGGGGGGGRVIAGSEKKDSVSSRWQSRRVDRLERSCTAAEAKVVAKSLLLLLLLLLIYFSSSLVPHQFSQ